jgi:hypothetical protein
VPKNSVFFSIGASSAAGSSSIAPVGFILPVFGAAGHRMGVRAFGRAGLRKAGPGNQHFAVGDGDAVRHLFRRRPAR